MMFSGDVSEIHVLKNFKFSFTLTLFIFILKKYFTQKLFKKKKNSD